MSYFRVLCADCKKILQAYSHAGTYNETRFSRCPECKEKCEKQAEENQIRRILEETGHL